MTEHEIASRFDIHDKIERELYEKKSIGAFVWIINQGRELELSYNGTEAFVSMYPSKATVSFWVQNDEQAFDSMEELYENAVIAGHKLSEVWDEIIFGTLF